MRLGIYGGSFDPVHNAHLAVARACKDQARLDQVWFVPTAVQPLKQPGPEASDVDRVEMLRLATEGEPTWRVSTVEIERGGMSYTVDTLRRIHEELPDATLFFLIGADALRDVPKWREPEEIFRLATPLVVCRAGEPESNFSKFAEIGLAAMTAQQVELPPIDISSSEIRRRIASGEAIDGMVPSAVSAYLLNRGLYGGRG